MEKYLIIANPAAGGASAWRVIPEIIRLLNEAGLDYQLEQTESSGHAIELADPIVPTGLEAIHDES